jgi:hypothetical protein
MIDKFGSFVVEKIILASTDEQRLTIIRAVAALTNLIDIACDPAGCGAVPKIIQHANSDEEWFLLLDALVPENTSVILSANTTQFKDPNTSFLKFINNRHGFHIGDCISTRFPVRLLLRVFTAPDTLNGFLRIDGRGKKLLHNVMSRANAAKSVLLHVAISTRLPHLPAPIRRRWEPLLQSMSDQCSNEE